MKSKHILRAIGGVSDKYVEESSPENDAQHKRPFRLNKILPIAAAFVVVIAVAIVAPNLINRNPYIDEPEPLPPENGAVYHAIDVAQIERQYSNTEDMFKDKLTEYLYYSGKVVRWETRDFTKQDVETAMQVSLTDPALPNGDYTTVQSVLEDATSGNIIAYQTVYYYYNIDTMVFQRSFSVFYFSRAYVNDNLKQSDNITNIDGVIQIGNFTSVPNADTKLPHVRELVYFQNDIAVVLEAETDVLLINDTIDEVESLLNYTRVDYQTIDIMKSLIK